MMVGMSTKKVKIIAVDLYRRPGDFIISLGHKREL